MIVDGSSNKNDMQERGWKAGTEKGIEKGWIAGIEEARKERQSGMARRDGMGMDAGESRNREKRHERRG